MARSIIDTIEPGDLRHLLTVEKVTVTDENDGETSDAWNSVGTRHAKIEPLAGRELLTAQQINAHVTHRVTIRFFSGLVPASYRFLFGSRIFNLVSVLLDSEIEAYHTVLCTENVSL